MAVREFIDAVGISWRVWCTRPSSRVALMLGYEQGWLTFESTGSLRRLMPVPRDWDTFPDRELERLCGTASPVVRRVRRDEGEGAVAKPTWWTDSSRASGQRRAGEG